MDWSNYRYLVLVLIISILVGLWAYRRRETLCGLSKARTIEELLLLGMLSIVGIAAIYWRVYTQKVGFAFGPGDISTDTLDQYVPFYTNLVERISSGSFGAWSFEYGLGANMPSYQTWLYDPFNIILVPLTLIMGVGKLSLALVLTQSLKILTCAFLFDHLLTRFCGIPLARAIASVLYAFSSFLILLGQHYFLGSLFPVLTFVVLCYELFLEKQSARSFLLVTACVAVVLLWSAYIAWMVLLFAAIYLLIRLVYLRWASGWRGVLKGVGMMCVPVVCGFLLSGVLLVPYALFLTQETARTSSDATLIGKVSSHLGPVNLDWVPVILSRLLGGSLLNNGFNNDPIVSDLSDVSYWGSFAQEFIQLGYSCGALILLSQFFCWLFKEGDKRQKISVEIATVLVLLYCFNQLLPTLFTGMVRFQYRSSAILSIPVCIAIAIALEKCVIPNRIAPVPLYVASLATFILLGWSMCHAVTGKLPAAVFGVLTVFVFVMLVLGAKLPNHSGMAITLALAGIVASTFFDGFYCTNNRGLVPLSSFPGFSESEVDKTTIEALGEILQDDTSMYRVEKTYHDHSLASDSMIQRYYGASQYNSTLDSDLLEFYDKLWPEAECSWAVYTQLYTEDVAVDPEILNLLGIRYVFSRDDIDLPWMQLESDADNVMTYRVSGSDSFLTLRGKVVSETEADNLGSAEARRSLLSDSVIVPDQVANSYSGMLDGFHATSSINKTGEGELEGRLSSDGLAVACLPVPNTGCWDVYIDGRKTESFRADYGFVGFIVPSGDHEISAVYRTEGEDVGILLSLFGVFTTVACTFAFYRKSKGNSVK